MATIASNPQKSFPSITAALKACAEEDTVYLLGRDYEENVELDKPVRIARAPDEKAEVVMLSSGKPTVQVTCKGVVLENITVKQSCKEEVESVVVKQGGSCVLRQVCITSEAGIGVAVFGGSVKLESCKTQDCGKYGVLVKDGGSVFARDSSILRSRAAGAVSRGKKSKLEMEKCTIEDNGGNGIGVDEGGKAMLQGTTISGSKNCGAMASGLYTSLQAQGCVLSKNSTHGLAAAGRASLKIGDCKVTGNKQLGVLIQSGSTAELSGSDLSRNGAHGLCLQLGGAVSAEGCSAHRNKQSGLAFMGVGSTAVVAELRAQDNGIDGVHVGQGAELTLKDSEIERSRRMGVSALGAGTRALLQDNVISDNGEHGIAQGTGAEVDVKGNRVEGNGKEDTVGHLHDVGGPATGAGGGSRGGKEGGRDATSSTPLLQSGKQVQIRRHARWAISTMVAALALAAAVYCYYVWSQMGAAVPRAIPHAISPGLADLRAPRAITTPRSAGAASSGSGMRHGGRGGGGGGLHAPGNR